MLGFSSFSLSPSEFLTVFQWSIHSFIFLFFNIELRPCFPSLSPQGFLLGEMIVAQDYLFGHPLSAL